MGTKIIFTRNGIKQIQSSDSSVVFEVPANVSSDQLADESSLSGLVSPPSSLTVMQLGDSLSTGSSIAPGGSRIELWRLARLAGIPLKLVGPVSQANAPSTTNLRPEPGDPFCAGYPGETIAQLTARCQSGGTIYSWVSSFGAPDVVIVGSVGTNDANSGTSAATMWTNMQALLSAISTLCPSAKIVVESIPLFYAGSTPTGGIAAANVIVTAFNALMSAGVAALGSQFSFLDAVSGFSAADTTSSDGVHLLPTGQAKKGAREFTHIVGLFPGSVLSSNTVPRSPRLRTATPMVKFTTTADTLANGTADDGWRIPAGNFLFGECLMFASGSPGAFTNLAYSAPGVQNYTHGFQLALDGSSTPKTLNLYTQFGGASAVLAKQVPNISAGKPIWVFAHGDRSLGVVSLWFAMQEIGTAAPWTVYCLGEVTGVAAWSASDASPKLHLGNYVDASPIGAIGSVFMASGSAGRATIRDTIESLVFDGTNVPGLVASLPCTEGSGTTIASNVGGQSATLSGGGWYTAGQVARLGDDTPPVVAGSKGANAALTSLISQLAALGLITDSTT